MRLLRRKSTQLDLSGTLRSKEYLTIFALNGFKMATQPHCLSFLLLIMIVSAPLGASEPQSTKENLIGLARHLQADFETVSLWAANQPPPKPEPDKSQPRWATISTAGTPGFDKDKLRGAFLRYAYNNNTVLLADALTTHNKTLNTATVAIYGADGIGVEKVASCRWQLVIASEKECQAAFSAFKRSPVSKAELELAVIKASLHGEVVVYVASPLPTVLVAGTTEESVRDICLRLDDYVKRKSSQRYGWKLRNEDLFWASRRYKPKTSQAWSSLLRVDPTAKELTIELQKDTVDIKYAGDPQAMSKMLQDYDLRIKHEPHGDSFRFQLPLSSKHTEISTDPIGGFLFVHLTLGYARSRFAHQ